MAAATRRMGGRRGPTHPALLRPDRLRIGEVDMALPEVASYRFETVVERDWDGLMLCAGLYGFAACALTVAVLLGLDLKFLIGVAFFFAITLMCLGDLMWTRPVVLHRLHLTLRDGRQATFVDGDERVVETIAARLQAAGARMV